MRNFRELLCSTIPPSKLNLRSRVPEDDYTITGSSSIDLQKGILSSKDKFDIEMGSKLGKNEGKPLPIILQNLDYSDIDDMLKEKEGDQDIPFDPFFFPVDQDNKRYSQQNPSVGYSIH